MLIDTEMSNLKRLLSISEEEFFQWIDRGTLYDIGEISPQHRIKVIKPPLESRSFGSSDLEIPEETNREEETKNETRNFEEVLDTRRSDLDTKRDFLN